MVSDTRIVQLVSAGLVACGLVAIASARMIWADGPSVGSVSESNRVSWSPRRWVFGVMWSIIFGSQGIFVVATAVVSLLNTETDDIVALFTQSAAAAGGLLMASIWQPLFTARKQWATAASAVLLACVAIVTTIGAIASKPFLVGGWWETIGSCSTSFFAGWTLTAAGLNVGITTRVYNRGFDSASGKDGLSLFPLILSMLVCVLSTVFANPVLSAPLFVALLTVPGVFQSWWLWAPALVALGGITGGVIVLYVYRGSGLWW
jgi:tryptophan-rich sensory protein